MGLESRTAGHPLLVSSGCPFQLPEAPPDSNAPDPDIRLVRRVYVHRLRRRGPRIVPLEPPAERRVPRDSQLSRNPIRRADQFQQLYAQTRSYTDVAQAFGCSKALVSYHVKLLRRLPDAFLVWVRGVDDPAALRELSQRQLRYASGLTNTAAQRRFLASLVQKAQARAAIARDPRWARSVS